jgi:cell division protein FtsQ
MKKQSVLKKQAVERRKKKPPVRQSRDKVSFVDNLIRLQKAGLTLGKVLIVLAVITVISIFFSSSYNYLLTCPYIRFEVVAFEGIDDGEIRQELKEMCDLENNLSLMAINLERLKEKMEGHPWVRSVSLERRFPHSLIVHAEKQAPRALARLDKNCFYYINKLGDPFLKADEKQNLDLPFITGTSFKQPDMNRVLDRVMSVINELSHQKKGPCSLSELSEIHLNKKGGISLYFNRFPAEIKLMCGLSVDYGQDTWQIYLKKKVDELNRVATHLSRSDRLLQVKSIYLDKDDEVVVSFNT